MLCTLKQCVLYVVLTCSTFFAFTIKCFIMFCDAYTCWVRDLGLLLLNFQILPLGLSYITMSGIFLYLLMVFQGCSRIVHALVYFWVLLSSLSQMLGLHWFLIFWAAVSCFINFCFIRLAFFAESIWLSWRHIPVLIWSASLCLA